VNQYEWNKTKAKTNKEKHGITFEEAIEVFEDPNLLTRFDENHSSLEEDRWQVIGKTKGKRVFFVVYVERERNCIRFISARRATVGEITLYRKHEKTR
jgi:uncharacterized protein